MNSTGLPFDSVMGIELNANRTMNPMVNAGVLATTSLVPGASAHEKFERIVDVLSCFAGRRLEVDEEVYGSEVATNFRNRGIADLLYGYGRMYSDPELATDVYTRQCALRVTARDLAVMGATLADGGVNPLTGQRAVSAACCRRVLAVLATSGAVRAFRGLALRCRAPRQERYQRGAGDGVAGQRGRRHLLPATRRGRQQRPRPADHDVLLRAPRSQPLRLGPARRRRRWRHAHRRVSRLTVPPPPPSGPRNFLPDAAKGLTILIHK